MEISVLGWLTWYPLPAIRRFFSEKARESAKPTTEKEALDRRLGSLGQERLTKP